jgi:hypothetical protein
VSLLVRGSDATEGPPAMGGGARLAMGNPHGDGAPARRWGGSPATWKGRSPDEGAPVPRLCGGTCGRGLAGSAEVDWVGSAPRGLGGSRDARGLLQDSQAKKEGGGRVFANCQHLSF